MNRALDHHFHGHPDRRFSLDGIRDELKLRQRRREPVMSDKHWKMKKTPKKGLKNAA